MSNPTIIFCRHILRLTLIVLATCILLSSRWSAFSFGNTNRSSTESIILFSSATLTNPKSVFNLGEKVWAVGSVSPPNYAGSKQLRIQWVSPDGLIKQQRDITANATSDSYQIPASAQVGTWLAKMVDNSNVGIAIANFIVRDPANPTADLAVDISGASQIAAGDKVAYQLKVINNGPDDAENVELEDFASKGATLLSVAPPQDWNCSATDSKATCAGSRLASGASAIFTIVFQVNSGSSANTTILNTATVSSRTTELHQPDNHSSAVSKILATACSPGCPEDVTRSFDAGMNGAAISYTDPESPLTCGNVVCNPPSGSFFPAGINTVVCSSENGGHCSFKVTVTGTVAINIIGANPLLVECHTEFRDAEVTAQNGSGDSIPVSSSGNVDTDTPGTYTITYTATDGSSTATATRTVEVVDTTPPIISCPAEITASADANCKATVPNLAGKVVAVDNCTSVGSLVITQIPAAGTLVGVGVTEITVEVKDSANNISTCTAIFSVNSVTLGSATVWVGLKSNDDTGVKFDLLAEVLRNGKPVGSGQVNDLAGAGDSFNDAISRTINLVLAAPVSFCAGDTLGIRLSVRIAADSSRRNGTARLWLTADTNFVATIGGLTKSYFLLDGFALGTAGVPGFKNTIDVFVDRAVGGNQFKPLGTWSKVF